MQCSDSVRVDPCGTETYNPADIVVNHIKNKMQIYDTDENYWDRLVPP